MKKILSLLCLALFLARSAQASELTLFETPRDRDVSLLTAIKSAQREVDVEIYEFTDPDIERALIDAHRAGVQVRVILNAQFPKKGSNPNRPIRARLLAAGVQVRNAPPYFRYTHEKALIIDGGASTQEALITTLNFSPGYLGKPDPQGNSLNFGLIDQAAADVATLKAIFEADWTATEFKRGDLRAGTPLVVSPLNSREQVLGQIEHASKTFHFFAQELMDPQTVSALVAAVGRGVEVKGLVASNFPENKVSAEQINRAGGEVRYLDVPYEHAKAAIADGTVVYIGSINLSEGSMDKNREVGLMTSQPDIAAQMEAAFGTFWVKARDF